MGLKGPCDLEERPSLAATSHSDSQPVRADHKQVASEREVLCIQTSVRITWAVGHLLALHGPRPCSGPHCAQKL